MNWSNKELKSLIENALAEDIKFGDITSEAVVPNSLESCAKIKAKQNGILAGIFLAQQVFGRVDKKMKFKIHREDGSRIRKGQIIASICGKTRSILKAERVALNFLQKLSGVATLTGEFVKRVKNTKVKILDTRKTTPTFRLLEKYAVRMGGGENHRFGLYDMILIKDNHIKAAGGIRKAILRAKSSLGRSRFKRKYKRIKIEVEVRNIRELGEAVKLGVDRVMLDNMSPNQIRKSIKLMRESKSKAKLEISGNINLKNIKRIAKSGVDFISIGAITHSASALDFNLVLN